MTRLDPELNILLAKKELSLAHPNEAGYAVDSTERLILKIQFKGDVQDIMTEGLTIVSQTAQTAHATASLDVVEKLIANPAMISIDLDRPATVDLHNSIPDIQADQIWHRTGNHFAGYSGVGVIVGIIDTGIDFRHRAFIRPDGKTRILKIWDQTINAPLNPPQGGETVPGPISNTSFPVLNTPMGYGVVYDANQINDAIAGNNPGGQARHKDDNGHGTHVAGIAAGNGKEPDGCSGEFYHVGVAPNANFVIVRLWGLSKGDDGSLMTPPANPLLTLTADTEVDAVKFIMNEGINQGMPVVINCSFGSYSDIFNGGDHLSTNIDTLLTTLSAGRSIVLSAGNNGASAFHAAATVPASGALATPLRFKIYPSDTKNRIFSIVYSGNNLEVKVNSPVGGAAGTTGWVTTASGGSPTANGANAAVTVARNPNRITVSLSTVAPVAPAVKQPHVASTDAAFWEIEIRNTSATATPFNAFALFGSTHDQKSPRFLNNVSTNMTLGESACCREALTVGNHIVGGQLAPSSGRGPTFAADGRVKPEICGPGQDIMSASIPKNRTDDTCETCCCSCCMDWYVSKGGTSMSAPHLTGLIALMFQKNPNLTHTQVKQILTANTNTPPADAPTSDLPGWGAGKASAKKAVDAVTQVNAPVPFVAASPELNKPVRQILLETEFGKSYLDAGEKYFKEIMHLINHNRRVATAWHRSRGPVWTRMAINAFYNSSYKIPLTSGAQRLADSIENFMKTLVEFASPVLKETLDLVKDKLQLLPDNITLPELIELIGSRPLENRVATSTNASQVQHQQLVMDE